MISHSKPFFDKRDYLAISSTLKTAFVTNGKKAEKLASLSAEIMNKRWGIAVQSGTDALILALSLLNLRNNAKIAIPAYACGAILDAVKFHNFTPIPIDISRETLAILTEKASNSEFDAVIAAHLFGIAAPLHKIKNKNLIEDCAQCIGIKYQNKIVGSSGKFSISSFYGTKLLCTGHGGIICGNRNYDYEKAMKILKYDKIEKWQPHFHFLLSDLNASIGISQLNKLDFFIKKRKEIASIYYEALGYNTNLAPNNAFFRFLIIPKGITQKELIAKFANAGIEACKPVYKPIFKLMNMPRQNFPESDWADKNLISIPIYPALKRSEIQKISSFLRKYKDEISCWPPA